MKYYNTFYVPEYIEKLIYKGLQKVTEEELKIEKHEHG